MSASKIDTSFWPGLKGQEIAKLNGSAWHEIGADGEPAFEDSFVNYTGGSPGDTCAFRRVLDRVYVKGLITGGSSPGNNTHIFTLPVEYRPPRMVRLPVVAFDGTDRDVVYFRIQPTDVGAQAGKVSFTRDIELTWNTTPDTGWIDLSNLQWSLV